MGVLERLTKAPLTPFDFRRGYAGFRGVRGELGQLGGDDGRHADPEKTKVCRDKFRIELDGLIKELCCFIGLLIQQAEVALLHECVHPRYWRTQVSDGPTAQKNIDDGFKQGDHENGQWGSLRGRPRLSSSSLAVDGLALW